MSLQSNFVSRLALMGTFVNGDRYAIDDPGCHRCTNTNRRCFSPDSRQPSRPRHTGRNRSRDSAFAEHNRYQPQRDDRTRSDRRFDDPDRLGGGRQRWSALTCCSTRQREQRQSWWRLNCNRNSAAQYAFVQRNAVIALLRGGPYGRFLPILRPPEEGGFLFVP